MLMGWWAASIGSLFAQPYGFIAGTSNGRVSVVDLNINQIIGNVEVISGGGSTTWGRGIAITPDRTKVFVSFRNANAIGVILVDTTYATFPMVDTVIDLPSSPNEFRPYGIGVVPDGSKVYFANEADASVTVMDVGTYHIDTTFDVGASPIGLSITPDGDKFVVGCRGSSARWTAIYSIPDHQLITRITGGSEPYGTTISEDGTRAYVADRGFDQVQIIDLIGDSLITTHPVGVQPGGLAVSADGNTLYVANTSTSARSVTVIDVSGPSPSTISTVSVGARVWDVGMTPDDNYAYAALFGGNALALINTNSLTVDETLPTLGSGVAGGNGANRPVGFGDFLGANLGNATSPSPFPVEWLGFDAVVDQSAIHLHWQTAQEINNQAFQIDRSVDGQNWTKVGMMPGVGTTAEPQSYQFADHYAQPGQPYYYRLRQIDFDGKSSFSPRVSATIPLQGQTRLFVDAKSEQLRITHTGATAELMDLSGRTLKTFGVQAGETRVSLNGLSVGMYLLRLTHPNGWIETHKILK